jgi:hypothetical protein
LPHASPTLSPRPKTERSGGEARTGREDWRGSRELLRRSAPASGPCALGWSCRVPVRHEPDRPGLRTRIMWPHSTAWYRGRSAPEWCCKTDNANVRFTTVPGWCRRTNNADVPAQSPTDLQSLNPLHHQQRPEHEEQHRRPVLDHLGRQGLAEPGPKRDRQHVGTDHAQR